MTTEERLKYIEERNKRVEDDKAWETSWTRRLLLAIFTYIAIGAYLYAINIQYPASLDKRHSADGRIHDFNADNAVFQKIVAR